MNDKFDDFFNEFFGGNQENNEENNEDKFDQEKNDSVEKFIDMITNYDDTKSIEDNFGNPDRIEYFWDDNIYFEKRIWDTKGGKITKISMVEPPETPEDFHKVEYGRISINGAEGSPLNQEAEDLFKWELRESLQQKLDLAISEENYEEAAKLRDQIKLFDEDE